MVAVSEIFKNSTSISYLLFDAFPELFELASLQELSHLQNFFDSGVGVKKVKGQ